MSRGGRGRPLVMCPGLASTQADLRELLGLLRRDHEVVGFDLRGHGKATAGERYSFEGFLSDLNAVMAGVSFAEPPVLVGYSLGADLVVHYASENPGAFSELVLIDGADPVPEPFLGEADLPEFRAMFQDPAIQEAREQTLGTEHQVLLTGADLLDLNIEVDLVRSRILQRYGMIDQPITMIMSTAMAGTDPDERTAWRNRNWQAGIDRLRTEHPDISATWIEADHTLVFTHAPQLADIIRQATADPR